MGLIIIWAIDRGGKLRAGRAYDRTAQRPDSQREEIEDHQRRETELPELADCPICPICSVLWILKTNPIKS